MTLTAREYPNLRRTAVLSRRLLGQHHALYARHVQEWNAIQERRKRVAWDRAPAGLELMPGQLRQLLDAPVASLDLAEPRGQLAGAIDGVRGEMNARGISFFPDVVAGEDEFFTYDRATTVSLPWYLFTDGLWWLVNGRHLRYDADEVARILRHEAAHALGYAFEVWKLPGWRAAFGDFDAPYLQAYVPDPRSTDHVRHLHRSGPWQNSHYAQKHPDEDWAETFATWLSPGEDWRSEYQLDTGARAKLEFVDHLVNRMGFFGGEPPNRARGRVEDWRSLTYTVREFLGIDRDDGWSDHAALARREAEVHASVVLHELYFEQMAVGTHGAPIGGFAALAAAAYGSHDAWAADLRALCLEGDGWALVTWDPRLGRLRNALVPGDAGGPPGAPVLIAVDLHEHAYQADYGNRRDLYAGAVLAALDWGAVDRRGRALGLWTLDLVEALG